jgi:acyl-CoA synthetase (AMP-forming)/AMP-acid ligase II
VKQSQDRLCPDPGVNPLEVETDTQRARSARVDQAIGAGAKPPAPPLYAFPTLGSQTLRALLRHPSRAAFVWDGGSISYRATAELIGRMQKVFINRGLQRDRCVAILTANRAEAWCAGVAAQLCAARITWLHPLGSLDDQLDQIEDSEASAAVFDVKTFRERGGELAARAAGLKTVFTLGPAEYGRADGGRRPAWRRRESDAGFFAELQEPVL